MIALILPVISNSTSISKTAGPLSGRTEPTHCLPLTNEYVGEAPILYRRYYERPNSTALNNPRVTRLI
jgi:hypothetical protein